MKRDKTEEAGKDRKQGDQGDDSGSKANASHEGGSSSIPGTIWSPQSIPGAASKHIPGVPPPKKKEATGTVEAPH